MATKLSKPVNRELNRVKATKRGRVEVPDKTGYIPMDARPVIASLLPSDVIQFRVKGTSRRYQAPLSLIMLIAEAITEHDDRQEKLRIRKLKKDAGYKRLREVKKVYNPQVASALRKLYNAVS